MKYITFFKKWTLSFCKRNGTSRNWKRHSDQKILLIYIKFDQIMKLHIGIAHVNSLRIIYLKGQSNEIFDLQFFSSFEPAWDPPRRKLLDCEQPPDWDWRPPQSWVGQGRGGRAACAPDAGQSSPSTSSSWYDSPSSSCDVPGMDCPLSLYSLLQQCPVSLLKWGKNIF